LAKAFLMIIPSEADLLAIAEYQKKYGKNIKIKQFLVSSGGIMEYICPDNYEETIKGASKIKEVTERVIIGLPSMVYDKYLPLLDEPGFISDCSNRLSKLLPDGFNLFFSPYSKSNLPVSIF
jgi:hypothetical protein